MRRQAARGRQHDRVVAESDGHHVSVDFLRQSAAEQLHLVQRRVHAKYVPRGVWRRATGDAFTNRAANVADPTGNTICQITNPQKREVPHDFADFDHKRHVLTTCTMDDLQFIQANVPGLGKVFTDAARAQ